MFRSPTSKLSEERRKTLKRPLLLTRSERKTEEMVGTSSTGGGANRG